MLCKARPSMPPAPGCSVVFAPSQAAVKTMFPCLIQRGRLCSTVVSSAWHTEHVCYRQTRLSQMSGGISCRALWVWSAALEALAPMTSCSRLAASDPDYIDSLSALTWAHPAAVLDHSACHSCQLTIMNTLIIAAVFASICNSKWKKVPWHVCSCANRAAGMLLLVVWPCRLSSEPCLPTSKASVKCWYLLRK